MSDAELRFPLDVSVTKEDFVKPSLQSFKTFLSQEILTNQFRCKHRTHNQFPHNQFHWQTLEEREGPSLGQTNVFHFHAVLRKIDLLPLFLGWGTTV